MFKIGETVEVLDGTGSDWWSEKMCKYIGSTFKIKSKVGSDYVLEGCKEAYEVNSGIFGYYWLFSSDWLKYPDAELEELDVMEIFNLEDLHEDKN